MKLAKVFNMIRVRVLMIAAVNKYLGTLRVKM